MRLLGSPQNTKQKQYVREFTPTMEDGGCRDHPDPDCALHFYKATGEFGYLSNLWGTPGTTQWRKLGGPIHLVIDDVCWPTVEHYFQAQKFDNRVLHEHTKRDLYWGDGMETNTGADMLGKMQIMLRTMYQHLHRHDMDVEAHDQSTEV